MKKQILFAAVLLLTANCLLPTAAFSQAPAAFKYQSIVRDVSGNSMTNTNVNVRATIHDGSATGPSVYQETHSVTTNQFGLINLEIGNGTVTSGNFSAIAWGSGSKWMQIEADFGSGYVPMGTSQLLSVPYALYADAPVGPTGATGPTGPGGGISNSCPTTDYIPKIISPSSIGCSQLFDNGTNVGIGTTSPLAKLQIANASGTDAFSIINNGSSGKVFYFSDISNTTATPRALFVLENTAGTAPNWVDAFVIQNNVRGGSANRQGLFVITDAGNSAANAGTFYVGAQLKGISSVGGLIFGANTYAQITSIATGGTAEAVGMESNVEVTSTGGGILNRRVGIQIVPTDIPATGLRGNVYDAGLFFTGSGTSWSDGILFDAGSVQNNLLRTLGGTYFSGIDVAASSFANAAIQLPNTTNASGGIRFGSDVTLYRAGPANLKTDGKLTVLGGVDPPYISFSDETHKTIRGYAKNIETHEKVMLFWNEQNKQMEIYVIEEDRFYTINGELITEK